MKRVEANADWSLFRPNEAPGMSDVHSAEFEALYEKEGRQRRTVPAQKFWCAILEAQIVGVRSWFTRMLRTVGLI